MYKKIFIALILVLMLFPPRIWAKDVCSTSGYTVFTINGMFTGKQEAIDNSNRLKNLLPSKYNNEPIFFDYLYNPSHIAGAGDVVDVISQTFEEKAGDYDLWKMTDELSKKAKTQKILFVGYSQGNFYANDIFEKITSERVGVPIEPLGVYSIATPDDHVAGNGLYLTSDTDKIINDFAWYFKKIMPPNTHIELKKDDGNGHSFVNVYLKYKNKKIVSDIKSSITKLKLDNSIDKSKPCVPKKEEATIIKIADVIIPVMDFLGEKLMKPVAETFKKIKSRIAPIQDILSKNPAAVIVSQDNIDSKINENIEIINTENTISQVITLKENEDSVATIASNVVLNTEEVVNENEEEKEVKKKHLTRSSNNNSKEKIEEIVEPIVEDEDDINEEQDESGEAQEADQEDDDQEDDDQEEEHENDQEQQNDQDDDQNEEESDEEEEPDPQDDVVLEDELQVEIVRGGYVYDYDENSPFFHLEDDRFDIELIGDKIVTLNVGDVYEEKGVKLVDKQNFKNTQPQIIGSVDTSKVGIYVIKYRAKEVNAPYTPYVARIINVIDGRLRDLDDKEAPSLNINGDSMIYVAENFKRYEEKGAISSDDNDGELEVTISETYYANIREMQRLAYISSDKSGNLTIKFREILSSSYIYIPRYKFGTRDENGNIWKAWFFDGSLVFDWSDKYVNNYLRQEFKIEAQPYPNFSCFTCMSKTIFKKDPTKGFDLTDYSRPAGPESHIQNRHDGQIYQVVIQWDENGYSTLITHGDIVDYSTYVEVEDVNENMWIGWSTSFSSISGSIERMWQPYATFSSLNLGGSIGMVLEPRKVYDTEVVNFEEGDWDYDEEGDKEGEDDDDSNEEDPLNEDDDDDDETGGGGEEGLETEEGDGESDEDVVVENPIILGIKVNNTEGAVDVDFVSNNALVEISSDRNVDWVSLKIENQEDSGLYKMFFSDGDACVDGTNTCSKSWSGELSNDDIPLKNGLYKVKIHVKDEFGVEIDEYLSYSINVINQPVL